VILTLVIFFVYHETTATDAATLLTVS
jgi:hypothetical protein